LPNLPALVRPGVDTLVVWAAGPPSITGWNATLAYGTMVPPPVFPAGGGFNAATNRWELRFTVPQIIGLGYGGGVPELTYDLVLTSDQTPPDTSRHAVALLPYFETDYYFAQISDTHLPSHKFSSDAGFSTADTSGFADYDAVAEDLNLIHPEFIIHTGDLVNEGELEDYLGMYEMSRAKEALSRLRAPVWVSTGNHDIGGWKPTPPPDGTSRKLWWKLFGWPFLANPPAGDPYHSQDFWFDYGPLHVIGLEAYINNGSYDSYNTAQYGAQSFTPEQMSWLAGNIASVPAGHTKLLFYHYDFGGTLGNGSPGANFSQINPAALGIDGAIWGHNHVVPEGNRTAKPFNLGLQSVIDYRAFRLFRVSNGVITPGPMHHSGGIAAAPTDSIVDRVQPLRRGLRALPARLPHAAGVRVVPGDGRLHRAGVRQRGHARRRGRVRGPAVDQHGGGGERLHRRRHRANRARGGRAPERPGAQPMAAQLGRRPRRHVRAPGAGGGRRPRRLRRGWTARGDARAGHARGGAAHRALGRRGIGGRRGAARHVLRAARGARRGADGAGGGRRVGRGNSYPGLNERAHRAPRRPSTDAPRRQHVAAPSRLAALPATRRGVARFSPLSLAVRGGAPSHDACIARAGARPEQPRPGDPRHA
jgi:hypothetical protein